ncbi:MAG: 16S rRNA (cytidine(1402)-2'-O)-methyltransferase [Burkholderiaceae bacterium]
MRKIDTIEPIGLGTLCRAGSESDDATELEPTGTMPGSAPVYRALQQSTTTQSILAHAAAALMQDAAGQVSPSATLYVVATPIGNAGDITLRALSILSLVDAVACEDTRNTGHLLARFGMRKHLIAAHQHNEREVAEKLIARLRGGQRIALVSDAGTPAVSDPGARIVDAVRSAGLQVVPLPGASAAVTALSASGLLDTQFHFAGFLPAKAAQRDSMLASLRSLRAALIFYEAPHRIAETVDALQAGFEASRQIVFARELTKLFEEIHCCPLMEAGAWIRAGGHREKGEYVVILGGAPAEIDRDRIEADRVLAILMAQCPLKQAAALAAQITGQKKNALYERALELKASRGIP